MSKMHKLLSSLTTSYSERWQQFKMRLLTIVLLLTLTSCTESCSIDGTWQRVPFDSDFTIPVVGSREIGVPISDELRLIIEKDSLHLMQDGEVWTRVHRITDSVIDFPDTSGFGVTWKIVSCDSDQLTLERSIGGIDPVMQTMRFERK